MKRILHIVGGMDRAGAETMLMNLYRNLNRSKYQFDFVYFRDNKCDYDDEILKLGGRIFRILNKNPINRTIALKKMIVKEAPFHAVQGHMLFSNGFHMVAAYLAKVNLRISHSHNTSDVNSKSFTGRLYQKISKVLIAKFSTTFIACGIKAGEFLFPKIKNIEFLLNAIDVESFSNNRIQKRNFLKDELNLDEGTIIITQIGRLSPVKNYKFTIKFAKFLKEKNVKFKVVIVGQGILKEELINLVDNYGLQEYVIFLGVRSDISDIIAGTNLILMPSFHEGFPVVLVETQASGVPSLISNTISQEVDLELGLVEFVNLKDKFSIWEEKLLKIISQKEISSDKILKTLTNKGFSIIESVKKLEKIYS